MLETKPKKPKNKSIEVGTRNQRTNSVKWYVKISDRNKRRDVKGVLGVTVSGGADLSEGVVQVIEALKEE